MPKRSDDPFDVLWDSGVSRWVLDGASVRQLPPFSATARAAAPPSDDELDDDIESELDDLDDDEDEDDGEDVDDEEDEDEDSYA